jgi:hypothetical protein
MPREVTAEQSTHRADAPMLHLEPREIRAGNERTDASRTERRRGEPRHDVEQARILEDAERVRVHRRTPPGTKNPNDAARPFGLSDPTEATTVTPAC